MTREDSHTTYKHTRSAAAGIMSELLVIRDVIRVELHLIVNIKSFCFENVEICDVCIFSSWWIDQNQDTIIHLIHSKMNLKSFYMYNKRWIKFYIRSNITYVFFVKQMYYVSLFGLLENWRWSFSIVTSIYLKCE